MDSHIVRRLICTALLFGWALWQTPLAAQPPYDAQPCYTYRIIDVTPPTGERISTFLYGINRAGVILGSHHSGASPRAYTLQRHGRTKVRVTHLSAPDGLRSEVATAINTQRDIAGIAYDPVTQTRLSYVRRHLKVPTIQRIQVLGGFDTAVEGMNSKRDLVGSFYRQDEMVEGNPGPVHGFWLYKGEYLQIDAPFPGVEGTQLTGINTQQDIVGWYSDQDGIHGLHIVDGITATLDVPDTPVSSCRALTTMEPSWAATCASTTKTSAIGPSNRSCTRPANL